jgi:oxidase EvaA
MTKLYNLKFLEYKKAILDLNIDKNIDENQLEFNFEGLRDWSIFNNFDEIKTWYQNIIKRKEMTVEEIPLNECDKWVIDNNKMYHESGEFFRVLGLRVKTDVRECQKGWDQPIIKQTGFDGGILGILRKRFKGIPHYLVEAKSEPGNPNMVQISPTLQATFSNINAAHLGNVPNYLHFFQNAEKIGKVHYKKWLAEDGGRLYNKRNLNMIVEVEEDYEIALANDNFIWMSLYQIKECLKQDAWVANSIRSIIAHL